MSADWAAVAEAISTRMDELGMPQKGLAERSRVSVATIRQLQRNYRARERSPRTLEALSVALGWAPGHLQAVREGTNPPSDPLAELRDQIADLSDRVAALEKR